MTRLSIGLNAVIVAVTDDEVPRVLTVDHQAGGGMMPALPFGPLDPIGDRTLDLGLRGWVREQTGLELGYVEQLYTFGDQDRDPERGFGGRTVSVAYLALVREQVSMIRGGAQWRGIYQLLPWEDWRGGRPPVLAHILPVLERFAAQGGSLREQRRERVEIAFAARSGRFDERRVLERYELVWEAGLAAESPHRRSGGDPPLVGEGMALDHRRMLATALGRLRGKLEYRPVVFELLSETFTLLQLQRVVEALAGVPLHKQNFRRLVERGGLVEGTGDYQPLTGGRPAELFRFRRDVLRERPAPGVGLPGARTGS